MFIFINIDNCNSWIADSIVQSWWFLVLRVWILAQNECMLFGIFPCTSVISYSVLSGGPALCKAAAVPNEAFQCQPFLVHIVAKYSWQREILCRLHWRPNLKWNINHSEQILGPPMHYVRSFVEHGRPLHVIIVIICSKNMHKCQQDHLEKTLKERPRPLIRKYNDRFNGIKGYSCAMRKARVPKCHFWYPENG